MAAGVFYARAARPFHEVHREEHRIREAWRGLVVPQARGRAAFPARACIAGANGSAYAGGPNSRSARASQRPRMTSPVSRDLDTRKRSSRRSSLKRAVSCARTATP
jgi:hypothetical protein